MICSGFLRVCPILMAVAGCCCKANADLRISHGHQNSLWVDKLRHSIHSLHFRAIHRKYTYCVCLHCRSIGTACLTTPRQMQFIVMEFFASSEKWDNEKGKNKYEQQGERDERTKWTCSHQETQSFLLTLLIKNKFYFVNYINCLVGDATVFYV